MQVYSSRRVLLCSQSSPFSHKTNKVHWAIRAFLSVLPWLPPFGNRALWSKMFSFRLFTGFLYQYNYDTHQLIICGTFSCQIFISAFWCSERGTLALPRISLLHSIEYHLIEKSSFKKALLCWWEVKQLYIMTALHPTWVFFFLVMHSSKSIKHVSRNSQINSMFPNCTFPYQPVYHLYVVLT
jgi:hypothetical protein